MQDQGPWDDCPAGAVTEMAGQLRRQRRHAQLRPRLFVGAATLLLCAIGYSLVHHNQPGSQGDLNCRETVPLLARYHAQSLDAPAADRVRNHLSHCPKCRKHYEELYPSEVHNRSSVDTGLLAVAARPRR